MNDERLKLLIAAEMEHTFIPPFDAAAIRGRATDSKRAARLSRKRSWLLPALLVCAPVAVAATTLLPSAEVREAIVHQFRAWHEPQKITFQGSRPVTITQARRDAQFHLVMPSQLPAGAKLQSVSESENGKTFVVWYALPMGTVQFIIGRYAPPEGTKVRFGSRVVMFSGNNPKNWKVLRMAAHTWIAGNEVVTASSAHLNLHQFNAIEHAMGARDAPTVKRP